MFEALRIRDFRLLWCGWTISSLGSWLLVVAVPAHVFALTGSYAATGFALAAQFLPPLVLGPFAGVLVDRLDRRRVMIAADLLRVVAVAALVLARTPSELWLVYLSLVVESTGTVLFRPAARAHVPVVVGTGRGLSSANSLNAAADGTVRLLGAPLGGGLFAVAGLDVVVGLDVATYLVAVVAAWLTTRHADDASRSGPGGVRSAVADLRAGARLLFRDRTIRSLFGINTVFLGANATMSAILVPFGVTVLGGSGQTGLLVSALGIGFLVATPIVRTLVDRAAPAVLLGVTLPVTGAAFVLLFASRSAATALPSAVLVGLTGCTVLVVVQTTLQRNCPNAMTGRMNSALFTGEAAATLVGSIVGPVLAQALSPSVLADLAGGVTALTGLAAILLRRATPSTPDDHAPS